MMSTDPSQPADLPDEIIAAILDQRPVLVVRQQDAFIEWAVSKVLGVFFKRDSALRTVLQHFFREQLCDFDYYDPAKRFYQRKQLLGDGMEWRDAWAHSVGHCHYYIEEWRPEQPACDSTTRFAFDCRFKDRVVNPGLTSAEARAQLREWRDQVSAGALPAALLDAFRSGSGADACVGWAGGSVSAGAAQSPREQWVLRHGSVPPYPFGETDPL